MNLRAGLVGLGAMGRHHARILATLEEVDFVGSCDPNSQLNSSSNGSAVFRSLEELIDKGLDYAVVAAPTQFHHEIAQSLAEARVHALIEKPIAHDSIAARSILDIFAKVNLIGSVGHIERFNPAIREAKARLSQLGSLYQISTRRQGPFPGRISDVGVVKDLATHDIDLTTWITGQNYVSVSARTANQSGRVNEDMLVAIGTLSEGTISNHIVNWLSPKKERIVVLSGENGCFEIDTLNADLTFFSNGNSKTTWEDLAHFRGVSEGHVTRYAFEKREPLLVEHENFRDAILGRPCEIVSIEDGVRIIEVAEALLQSAKDKKTLLVN